jgi:hypothetical protein
MSLFGYGAGAAGRVGAQRPSVGGLVRLVTCGLTDSLSGRFTDRAVVGRFFPDNPADLTADLGARPAGGATKLGGSRGG